MKNKPKGKRARQRNRSPYAKYGKRPYVYSEPFQQLYGEGGELRLTVDNITRWENFVQRINGWHCMPGYC